MRLIRVILGLVALFVGFSAIGLVSYACTPEALEDAKDPALLQQIDNRVDQRQQLCASLPLLAGFVPAGVLENALVACAHGDTVQAIAGALGGCYEPASSGGTQGGAGAPPSGSGGSQGGAAESQQSAGTPPAQQPAVGG